MPETIIEELRISEFRGIRELRRPIKLGGFNVLIGRNNVGKTAILEALYLFSMPLDVSPSTYCKDPVYGEARLKLLAKLHGGTPALVYGYAGAARLTIKPKNAEPVSIEITRSGLQEVDLQGVPLRNTSDDLKRYANFLKEHFNIDVREGQILCFYLPNDSRAYDKVKEYVLRDENWSRIEKRGLHTHVIKDLLSAAVRDRFTEALIKRDRLCLRKEVSENIGPLYVNVDSLGEGVRRALLTYLAVECLDPRIILWDDIEVAAHPSLLEAVLRWLASMNRQVVITTHSIDVLYYLTQIAPTDCRILAFDKSEDDTVDYKVITLEELDSLLEGGIDPRKIAEELGL